MIIVDIAIVITRLILRGLELVSCLGMDYYLVSALFTVYVPHMYFLCMEIDWVVTSVDFEILQKGNHHFLLELWSMKMRRDVKGCTCLQDVLLAWSHWREKR